MRAGHWDQGIYSSFETLLRPGLFFARPRGPHAELSDHQCLYVPGSGLGPGDIVGNKTRHDSRPPGAHSRPDSQANSRPGANNHTREPVTPTETGRKDRAGFSQLCWAWEGAGLVEQGGLTWDRNGESEGSSLGGETAPGQRAGHQPVAGIERTGRRPSRGPETEDVRGCGRWAECRCDRIIKGQSLGASAIAIPSPRNACPLTPSTTASAPQHQPPSGTLGVRFFSGVRSLSHQRISSLRAGSWEILPTAVLCPSKGGTQCAFTDTSF